MKTENQEYIVERFESMVPIEELLREYFDFPYTLSKCRECSTYGKTWACPELDFDPEEFLGGFSTFRLIVDRVFNDGTSTPAEAEERLFAEKRRFDKDMRDIEATIPGSYALAAQECIECGTCARQFGKPCVHPEIMRFGLEAIGCFPVKLVKDKCGFNILWSDGTSIPEYYLLVAGVLLP